MGIEEWADLMTDTVKVSPFIKRDTYGDPTYGKLSSYKARVNYETHFIRAATGEQVVARGWAIMATVNPVSVNDKISLPDGSSPLILTVNVETDEKGPLYTRLDFA